LLQNQALMSQPKQVKKSSPPKNLPHKKEPGSAFSKGSKTIPLNMRPPSLLKGNSYFVLIFFVLAFVLYGNTTWNKYAVDDEFVTGPDNPTVSLGLKGIPQIFSTLYVSNTGNVGSQAADYRPIVKLTFALEYQLWGQKPGVSHGINVLIYFFLSTLLFFILKRILKNYNILFPFLITVLFMIHPVHTEVVASLKNRDEMLAFLCGLGGLYYLLKYVELKKNRYIVYTFIIFILGYLSKSSILPWLVLYCLVLYFFTEVPPKKIFTILLILMAAAAFAYFVPRFFIPKGQRVNDYIENPLYFEKNFWLRLGTGLLSLLFYLKMLVYPHPLVFYYGYNTIPVTNLWNIWVMLSFVIYFSLLVYALMKFREKHLLSFAILFYMVAIAMYSNIVVAVVGIVGERFVFAGSVGFSMAVVYIIFRVFKTDPKNLTIEISDRLKILAVIAVLLVPSAYYTIKRNRAWRSMFDLCGRDLEHSTKSAKVNIQFAGLLMNRVYKAKPEDQQSMLHLVTPAITLYFRKALDIYPYNYQTLNDLGSVYINFAAKPDSAILYLKKAIALDPKLQPAWVNLGLAYRRKELYDSALYCYRKILEMNPKEVNAIIAMANVYNDLGDINKALEMNQEALNVAPESDLPYRNIGNFYISRGDTADAVKYWEMAVQKNPAYDVCMQLNSLYRIRGDMEKANYYYELGMQANRKRPPG
jgi:protein O-mannosyl-transferase